MNVAETLDRYGLTTSDSVTRIIGLADAKKLLKIDEDLRQAVDLDFHGPRGSSRETSPFDFWPNGELAGYRGGCLEPDCRVASADKLLRFGSLWADTIYLPPYFGQAHLLPSTDDARYSLAGSLQIIASARPAIDHGIVTLAAPGLYFCNEHALESKKEAIRTQEVLGRAEQEMIERYCDAVLIHFETHPGGQYCIEFEGPDDLLPHGCMYYSTRAPEAAPAWLPARIRSIAAAGEDVYYHVENRREKRAALELVIDNIAADTFGQHMYCRVLQAKYLTDRKADADFLSAINEDPQLDDWTTTMAQGLTYSMPWLEDVPISELISIRQQEFDAFVVYRDALGRIVRERVRSTGRVLTPEEFREVFEDEVRPSLNKMNQQLSSIRDKLSIRFMGDIAVIGLMMIVGVTSGIVFQEPLAVAAASPSLPAAADAVRTIVKSNHAGAELANENFYFLWRVMNPQA